MCVYVCVHICVCVYDVATSRVGFLCILSKRALHINYFFLQRPIYPQKSHSVYEVATTCRLFIHSEYKTSIQKPKEPYISTNESYISAKETPVVVGYDSNCVCVCVRTCVRVCLSWLQCAGSLYIVSKELYM